MFFIPSHSGLQYTGIYWALGDIGTTFPSLLATNSGRIGTSPVLAQKLCTNCCFFYSLLMGFPDQAGGGQLIFVGHFGLHFA